MTGTPIENRLADLWCLIDTLQPGRLGALKDFSNKYEENFSETISRELKSDLTESQNDIPALMLRRMKQTSLEGLPKIHHHYMDELMPRMQADAYKSIIESAKELPESGRQLDALHRLRAISLHPNSKQKIAGDESFISESARLRATFKILDKIYEKREKVLIFIEFREWHESDFLPAILKRRYKLPELPMVISGAIKVSERQARVDKFQDDTGKFDVMLLSPRAGGVGLTLTRANHVIHLSRWWNPAVEDQCTDRVYRIGQTKEVHVYYPMARHPELGDNTFDFCLKQLLDTKRHLSRTMLLPPLRDSDINQLQNAVIFNNSSSHHIEKTPYSLNEINCMEPRQFEDWIANECKFSGLTIKKTQESWDAGADIFIHDYTGKIIGIIQCKHSQKEKISWDAINDLLRARDAYQVSDAKLIAVTNAPRFIPHVYEFANQNNIKLISGNEIIQSGKIISEMFDCA